MIWLALAVAVLLWWLMTGLALMSVHQPRALRQPIFLLATIFATVSIWGVEANYLGMARAQLPHGLHHRAGEAPCNRVDDLAAAVLQRLGHHHLS